MNKADLDDLKQYIFATISQSESRIVEKLEERILESETRLESRLESRLGKRIDDLRTEMLAGFAGLADAFEIVHEDIEKLRLKPERAV